MKRCAKLMACFISLALAVSSLTPAYAAEEADISKDENVFMILNPDGTILAEAPMGLPWLIKADLYPSVVTKNHEQQVTSNFHWTYKHRGASHPSVAGEGKNLDEYQNKNS